MSTTKQFAVLYTGGTIGMQASDDGLQPSQDSVRAALARYTDTQNWQLTVCNPLIDSSQVTPAHWCEWINWLQAQSCDGVLILHGTDTLAYSANVLAFACAHSTLPVVITGSQFPLGTAGGDAEDNLQAAIAALLQDAAPRGVSVVFDGELLPAIGCRKISTQSLHGFDNKNVAPIATWQQGQWVKTNPLKRPVNLSAPLLQPWQAHWHIASHYCLPVGEQLALRALLHSGADALIVQSFGHGNGLFSEQDVLALQQFQAEGGVVVNVSQVADGQVARAYAASKALRDAGVLALGAWTVETAYAKLWVGLNMGLTGQALSLMVQQNWLGEWD